MDVYNTRAASLVPAYLHLPSSTSTHVHAYTHMYAQCYAKIIFGLGRKEQRNKSYRLKKK